MSSQLYQKFSQLPLYIKCIFVGISMSVLGLFFNWFSSVDSFDKGISYNGLNGPTFFAGYTILLLGIYSLLAMLKYLKNNECEISMLKKYYVEKWVGIVNLHLSLVSVTVYLSGFSTDSLESSLGTGFFITVAGSAITILGSILFKTKSYAKIKIDDNQLDLDLGGLELEPEEISDLADEVDYNQYGFGTKDMVHGIISENDPVYREQMKKQKEIEAKIHQK